VLKNEWIATVFYNVLNIYRSIYFIIATYLCIYLNKFQIDKLCLIVFLHASINRSSPLSYVRSGGKHAYAC
jgi:hypothetical protein